MPHPLGRGPGDIGLRQRRKDIVECWLANREVLDRDVRRGDVVDEMPELAQAVSAIIITGDAHGSRALIRDGRALAQHRSQLCKAFRRRCGDQDSSTADLGLQAGGRTLRDDASLVDDGDDIGELIRLVKIVRGQQHGRPPVDERADRGPERVPG